VVISFLLAMGIKSARASILLDVVALTISDQYKESDISVGIFSDLVTFVGQLSTTGLKTQPSRPLKQQSITCI
jgi:hypothetical protein